LTHHIGSGDNHVEVEEVLGLDLGDDVFRAHDVRARFKCGFGFVAARDNEDFHRFTGAVGKDNRAANLLIRTDGDRRRGEREVRSFRRI